jgi:hypothetical protein
MDLAWIVVWGGLGAFALCCRVLWLTVTRP